MNVTLMRNKEDYELFILLSILLSFLIFCLILLIILFFIAYLIHVFQTICAETDYDFSTYDVFLQEFENLKNRKDTIVKVDDFWDYLCIQRLGNFASFYTIARFEVERIHFEKGNMILLSPIDYFKYILFLFNFKRNFRLNERKKYRKNGLFGGSNDENL